MKIFRRKNPYRIIKLLSKPLFWGLPTDYSKGKGYHSGKEVHRKKCFNKNAYSATYVGFKNRIDT